MRHYRNYDTLWVTMHYYDTKWKSCQIYESKWNSTKTESTKSNLKKSMKIYEKGFVRKMPLNSKMEGIIETQ